MPTCCLNQWSIWTIPAQFVCVYIWAQNKMWLLTQNLWLWLCACIVVMSNIDCNGYLFKYVFLYIYIYIVHVYTCLCKRTLSFHMHTLFSIVFNVYPCRCIYTYLTYPYIAYIFVFLSRRVTQCATLLTAGWRDHRLLSAAGWAAASCVGRRWYTGSEHWVVNGSWSFLGDR